MKMYFSSTVNQNRDTYGTAVHTFDDIKRVTDGNCMVKLDGGRHKRRFIEILQKEYSVVWDAEPLGMLYAFRADRKLI